jgi:hypothetical protein
VDCSICAQAYLASESDDDGSEGPPAASVEEYRRLLLEGAGAEQPVHRKGGKDWTAAANDPNGQGATDDGSRVSAFLFRYCSVLSVWALQLPAGACRSQQALRVV